MIVSIFRFLFADVSGGLAREAKTMAQNSKRRNSMRAGVFIFARVNPTGFKRQVHDPTGANHSLKCIFNTGQKLDYLTFVSNLEIDRRLISK